MVEELEEMSLKAEAKEISDYYTSIKQDITEEVFRNDGFQRFCILYSAFIFCRLFHNCIFNLAAKVL